MEGQQKHQPQLAAIVIPFPAQGHLNPLLHLSHIISSHGLSVHYAGSSTHNRQVKLRLHGWDPQIINNIHFHDFQLPPYCSPPPKRDLTNQSPPTQLSIFDASLTLRQPISQLLKQLSTKFRKIILIFDILMTSVVQDVKFIPNSESYAFYPTTAFTVFFNTWDLMPQKPFRLESDVPKSIPSMEGCYIPELKDFLIDQRKLLGFELGRLYNSSNIVEGKYIDLLKKLQNNIQHFAIGPLNPVILRTTNGSEDRHISLKWLDKQVKDSVIYISFGSTSSLIDEQIEEMALGLERSGQKFIWVLIKADIGKAKYSQLPEGYEERVKDRGIVIREWAPQLEILAHHSVGGFMSHCGSNSCLESISMGVPMVAWPMSTDQPRNAVLVTQVLKIGILVRDRTYMGEVVKASEIENVVRRLMKSNEGQEMRRRANELGEDVRRSVANDGASRDFISHITRSSSCHVG